MKQVLIKDNVVVRVIIADNEFIADYLADNQDNFDCAVGLEDDVWWPGIGYIYDPENETFSPPNDLPASADEDTV